MDVFLWLTGSELDTYTTEQLGMCEKEDLVNYILSLKDNILERQDCLTDLEEEVERLQAWEENNLIHKDSVKPVKRVTRSDTRIKQLEEQLEKLKLESHLYDECVVKGMNNHIKRLKEEAIRYRTYHGDKCNECEEQRERADFNEKEIKKLKEENEELIEDNESLQNANDDLIEGKDDGVNWGLDQEDVENWIKDSGKVLVDKDEYEQLKDEINKLKEQQAPAPELWIRGTIESNSKLFKENDKLKEEIEQLNKEAKKIEEAVRSADGNALELCLPIWYGEDEDEE